MVAACLLHKRRTPHRGNGDCPPALTRNQTLQSVPCISLTLPESPSVFQIPGRVPTSESVWALQEDVWVTRSLPSHPDDWNPHCFSQPDVEDVRLPTPYSGLGSLMWSWSPLFLCGEPLQSRHSSQISFATARFGASSSCVLSPPTNLNVAPSPHP